MLTDPWFYTSVVFGATTVFLVLALAHLNELCNRRERQIKNLEDYRSIMEFQATRPIYSRHQLRVVK